MRKFVLLLSLGVVLSLHAGPTNSILFVTQVQVPADFTTIGSTFGNQKPDLESCARGGDLCIRYPNGMITNLTRAAGFGQWGDQATNGIAVRQPSMHWSGKKAVFSMVVGAPRVQFDYSPTGYWQMYEITNFTDPGSTPVITKVPNQPTNYNNVAPIYGTDDRIIFTSDRPRNGQANLYPQLDEYEEAPTVTGIWSLQPTNGDLFLLNHTPSGAFSPLIDSQGRLIFVRWDHMQRDQQADTDWEEHNTGFGAFNWSDESTNSVMTTNQTEVFPEPRTVRTDLLAGTGLTGEEFNQFFPWQINEDGTAEETVNHVGRHELGGSYPNAAFTNDKNIVALDYYGDNYNTNTIRNFLEIREDPRVPGLFYGIDAPEFGTHSAGQIISMTGSTNLNAEQMKISYLTPLSTRSPVTDSNNIPTDDSGAYRNPLMTTDGYLIASHSSCVIGEVPITDTNDVVFGSSYDFRLKFLQLSNGFYVPGAPLTAGLTNWASYWSPDELVIQTNLLWEFDPVEVVARPRPARIVEQIAPPELAAFAVAGVDVNAFRSYLRTHELALIISRDVTTRDHADHQQPFNLRVDSTTHETIGTTGKIYDVAAMQLFQADQLRSLNRGNPTNPGDGRRVIAQYLHEPAVDNPSGAVLASVKIGPDGSQAAIVPAQRALSWQLTDTNGVGVVRERYWLTFAPGEIRTCTSCHGVNETDQAGQLAPTNSPQALVALLNYWKSNTTAKSSMAANQGTNCLQISFVHRPAEPGVTYHVQESMTLSSWSDIATYSGTNGVLTAHAAEISRVGSPNETVTVRDIPSVAGRTSTYLRVVVTRP